MQVFATYERLKVAALMPMPLNGYRFVVDRKMTLDLTSLRCVMAAAEHGSFRQAGVALNLKQSALSRRIRHLEAQLGVSIFERSSGGVRLTPAGTNLQHAARRLFGEIDGIVRSAQLASRGEAGMLKAGFSTSVSPNRLHATLAGYIRLFPEIGLQVVERSLSQLIEALSVRNLDIAIVAGQARQHGSASMSLWSERLIVALSAKHPLSNNEVVEWSDLKDETFLLSRCDPGLDLRDIIVKKLAAPGDTPRIETWDVSNENILAMLEAGLHVSVQCESWAAANYQGVRFRELHDATGPSHITFTACWHRENTNPVLRRFLEHLCKTHYPTRVI